LFYFSRATITRLLEKRAGLRVDDISAVGVWRSYTGMVHGVFGGSPKTAWLVSILTAGGRFDVPIYLNLFDIMRVIARKPGGPAAV
jgi:hypothetical protein